jgi:hypothetical protein
MIHLIARAIGNPSLTLQGVFNVFWFNAARKMLNAH